MTDAFVAAYMQACKDRPADHNEIGLWYFRKGWEAGIEHEHLARIEDVTEYEIEFAIKLAELWRDGKMIGGDQDAVCNALLDEIKRLRSAVADTLEK